MPSEQKGKGRRRDAEGRAASQRARILEAAKKRFIEHGFHAAGMAGIAEEAGISPGLIYRYFANKRAIILAIIEEQLAENRQAVEGLQFSTDFVEELARAYALWGAGDPQVWNATLFSEITAESTRDPVVAEALRRSEQGARDAFVDWLIRRDRAAGRRTTRRQAGLRTVLMQCLVEGMAIRAAREPGLDPRLVKALLRKALPAVLEP